MILVETPFGSTTSAGVTHRYKRCSTADGWSCMTPSWVSSRAGISGIEAGRSRVSSLDAVRSRKLSQQMVVAFVDVTAEAERGCREVAVILREIIGQMAAEQSGLRPTIHASHIRSF